MDNYLSLFSPVLTIIGWSIAYRLAKVNSTRTESKSLLEGCSSIIEKLAEEGASFFHKDESSNEQKKSFESLVYNKLTLLHNKFEYLERRGIALSFEHISDFHIALTNAVPQHGSEDFKTDRCVNEIYKTSSKTILYLQNKFHDKYPPIESLLSLKKYF